MNSPDHDRHAARTPFDRTYRGIVRALHEGRLVPGQRLVEPDLMADFAVGRSTVREVLVRLSSVGIVDIVRHRGAVVRRLTREEVGDLLDLVEALLALAAAKAAGRSGGTAPVGMLDALEAALAKDDRDAFVVARDAFYRTVVDRSGNRELARLFPDALVTIMRRQLGAHGRGIDGMDIDGYRAIADALAAGDADGAEHASRAHVRAVKAMVAAYPDRAFAATGRGADGGMVTVAD